MSQSKTNEELVELFKSASSQKTRDEAFAELYSCNIKMLSKLVKNVWYNKNQIKPQELRHFALIGLFNAAKHFKPNCKAKFSTYAYNVIQNYLREEVRNSDMIPVSNYLRKKGCEIKIMTRFTDVLIEWYPDLQS
jgi:DNA-directed RNA polymerase specialized sigma subunit